MGPCASCPNPLPVKSPVKYGWDRVCIRTVRCAKFDDDGNLFLQVRWFGFRSKDDTWKLATSLPRESVRKYGERARIKLPGLTPLGNLLFGNRKAIPRRAPKISRVPKEPEGTTVTGQEPTSKGLGQPPDWTTERERAQPV